MSVHKWSGRTIYVVIDGTLDQLCCHKWSPRTIYAWTMYAVTDQSREANQILDRGFAGHLPELKWLLTSPIFSGFSHFFRHFEGQRYRTFYSKNHRHYCDLNANQVCYTFRYVLSYFHNENELTELKHFISGRNSIFVYKLQYILTSKMADFILLTWLQLGKN